MSDTMPHRHANAHRANEDASGRRAGSSLLLWMLLLIVIIATAWYFIGRENDSAPRPEAVPIGDAAPQVSRSPVSAPPESRDRTARERATPALPDRDALPLGRPAPVYPAAAQRAGEQGTVLLQVEVGADGRPGNIEVAQRSGSRELDRAAIEAVRDWTFEPAIRNGQPVASSVQVPVEFRLDTM